MKLNVYLAQVNHTYSRNVFLPYSVGLLQAYCQTQAELSEYDFRGLLFTRDDPVQVVKNFDEPVVVGISCYIWNWEYSKTLARLVKEAYPDCLVVLGGPQVPTRSVGFFVEHPYVDLLAHYEGELTFADILRERLGDKDFTKIPGLSINVNGETVATPHRGRTADLETLPSPYLGGVFDKIMDSRYDFHASQETHRGCPYSCTFCDWGSSVFQKVRQFDESRLVAELEWFGKRQIELLYNCFGRETEFVARSGVVSFNEFQDGDLVDVLTHSGHWQHAVVRCLGRQPLWEVGFAKGGKRGRIKTVRVTRNHRWLLETGDTVDLQIGDRLRAAPHVFAFEYNNALPDEKLYWCYGYVYGDGTRVKNKFGQHQYSMVRICGKDAAEFGSRFEEMGFQTSTNHSLRGDVFAYTGKYLKTLPAIETESIGRLTAFVAGYLAADGNKSTHNDSTQYDGIQATGREAIDFIRRIFPLVGIYILGEHVISPETNLGTRSAETIKFRITENTHVRTNAAWTVLNIRPLNVTESVWCLEVENDRSFSFPCGVVTGNCDANYGLLPRDESLTEKMVDTKRRLGFPQQFRAAYAKKSSDRIFTIAKMLNDAGMSKGVTLSFQSMDEQTQKTIKRENIGIATFEGLMHRYHASKIPTYTELILGLPGESYESFVAGVDKLLSAGQHDSLSIYMCAVLPNSEMGDPVYRAAHEIKSVRMPILLQHRSALSEELPEYNDVVVSTKTMPRDDWIKTYMFAWAVQTFHCLAITQPLAIYLHETRGVPYRQFYEDLIQYAIDQPTSLIGCEYRDTRRVVDTALAGGKWDVVLPEFGDIVWPTEEASFLKIIRKWNRFLAELAAFAYARFGYSDTLENLLWYQRRIVKHPSDSLGMWFSLKYDFPAFFDGVYTGVRIPLESGHFEVQIESEEFPNMMEFARRAVWYGRKGGGTRYRNIVSRKVGA